MSQSRKEEKVGQKFMYFAEFVKFSTGFAVIVALALFVLRATTAAAQNLAF